LRSTCCNQHVLTDAISKSSHGRDHGKSAKQTERHVQEGFPAFRTRRATDRAVRDSRRPGELAPSHYANDIHCH
jgi:hypothetical protein